MAGRERDGARRNPEDARQEQKNGRTNPRCHSEGARTAWKPKRRPEGKERVAKKPEITKSTDEKTRVGGNKKRAGREKPRGIARKAKTDGSGKGDGKTRAECGKTRAADGKRTGLRG